MKRYLILIMLGIAALGANAQLMTIKTNALADVMTVPNLGFELRTGSRTSLNAEVYIGYKMLGQNMKMQAVTPEFRYWPMGDAMERLFVGLSTMFTHYDFKYSKEAFNGDAMGAGITFGWVWPLTKYHWLIEAQASVGAIYYTQTHRFTTDYNYPRHKYNEHGMMFMPYKLGVSFCYILHYRNEVDSKITKEQKAQLKEEKRLQKEEKARLKEEQRKQKEALKSNKAEQQPQ